MFQDLHIGALSLITSCGCNLNCEYCHIAQSVNDSSALLQENTIKALCDGTFLQNTKNVLKKLGQSPTQIRQISLWGQEPTLTLHYLTEHLDDWMDNFSNVEGLMFSTNGMAYGERIVDFVKKMDEVVSRPFSINIQFSFDGEESTDNIRNADTQKIFNTISYILNELNRIKLNYVKVVAFFHGVVSLDLINRLDTTDKIIKYYQNLDDWATKLASINLNKQVLVEPGVSLALENPVDATTEDGLKLANFIKKSIKINPSHFKNSTEVASSSLIAQYFNYQEILYPFIQEYKGLKDIVHEIAINKKCLKDFNHQTSGLLYCGNNYGELKIMYDGTCINCQNSIYERESKYIAKDDSLENAVKRSLADHHYYMNPLLDDDLTIEKNLELFKMGRESSFMFLYQTTVNTMVWLLQAHQIDESYHNIEKLLTHAIVLTWANSCQYNNYVKTGSMFLRPTGFIRLYCNGFLDEILNGTQGWTFEKEAPQHELRF